MAKNEARASMTIRRRIGNFLIVCLSLVWFVNDAHAAVVVGDLGTLSAGSNPNFGNVTNNLGTGDTDGEIFSFGVNATASGGASASTINVDVLGTVWVGIDDFSISLIEANGSDFGSGFMILDSSGTGDNVALAFSGLLDPSELYGILIRGNVTGLLFGSYVGTLSVVPLPPALWLFLSALVGLVAVVRHKRQKNPAGLAPEPAVAA